MVQCRFAAIADTEERTVDFRLRPEADLRDTCLSIRADALSAWPATAKVTTY
jgi:hypothetical protein